MLTLVDYGLGNIHAFANIYKRLNIPFRIAKSADDLCVATKIILPGVGSFDWAMLRLDQSGMRQVLDELVVGRHCPVLGVCVGMQMMARMSEEGNLPGLGWIDATVKRFDESRFNQTTHLPHMGWNDVVPLSKETIFRHLDVPRFYFLHSYYFASANHDQQLALTDYNGAFCSAVCSGHIFGVQFHPEKSHEWGVQLLRNFAEL